MANGRSERAYCLDCQAERVKVPDRLPDGAVTVEEAKYRELLFHRFMDDALERTRVWPDDESFRRHKLTKTSLDNVDDSADSYLAEHPFRDALAERAGQLPSNEGAQARLVYKKSTRWPFRVKKVVNLALCSYSPNLTLLERGYMAGPVGGTELSTALEQFEMTASGDEIVIVFSPTGWLETMAIPANVVLVGLGSDSDWEYRFNLSSPGEEHFVKALFDMKDPEKKVDRCVEAVFKQPGANFPLSARSIADQEKLPLHMVAEAFRRLTGREKGLIVCDDSVRNDWLLDIR